MPHFFMQTQRGFSRALSPASPDGLRSSPHGSGPRWPDKSKSERMSQTFQWFLGAQFCWRLGSVDRMSCMYMGTYNVLLLIGNHNEENPCT